MLVEQEMAIGDIEYVVVWGNINIPISFRVRLCVPNGWEVVQVNLHVCHAAVRTLDHATRTSTIKTDLQHFIAKCLGPLEYAPKNTIFMVNGRPSEVNFED
jgi:hypothetical protein